MSHQIDTKLATEKLNNIIDVQKNNILLAKESIKSSSEQQRQPDEVDAAYGNTELQLATSHIVRADQTIKKCHAALEQIKRGEYGLCTSCWDDIEIERIIVTPYLDNCSTCSQLSEIKKRSMR